eukprot:scaffold2481_cov83-Cyclotella_meneghiniana.AAC.1
MFNQVLSPINEHHSSTPQQHEPRATASCCIHRLLHYGAITLLSIGTTFLFLQTQAISVQLARQQHEIDSLRNQLTNTSQHMEAQVEQAKDLTVIHMAGTFTLLTCLLTLFHMTAHLRRMNQPLVQRKILAILWMSPIYGLTSFLCLVLPPSAEGYLTILKDFYESYVIYTFLSFLIAVLGRGDRERVIRTLRHGTHLKQPYRWMRCLFHPPPEESEEALARAVLMECQVLGMQFVFLNSIIAVMEFVLELVSVSSQEEEEETNKGQFAFFYSPKFILMMIRNVSVFLAFSGLLKFYHAVRDELACTNNNANTDDESTVSASGIQHILICMEMLFFSIAHWCVFPAEEWEDDYKVQYYQRPGFGFKDFASDLSLIIDDGKKSIRARREMKKGNVNGLAYNGKENESITTSELSLNGRESPDFGSLHESNSIETELESDRSAQPLILFGSDEAVSWNGGATLTEYTDCLLV